MGFLGILIKFIRGDLYIMKKKRATRNFIILAILLFVCFLFSFISFRIPSTVDNFVGFINGLYKGIDVVGGVGATYTVNYTDDFKGDMDDAIDKAVTRVSDLLNRDFNEYIVEKSNDNAIKVVIPRLEESTTITTNYLVNYITFTTTEVTDSNRETFEPTFTGNNIVSSEYYTGNGVFGALIKFNDEGKEALKTMADSLSSNGTLYIYQDKNYSSVLLRISVDKDSLTQIAENNQLFISDVSLFPNKEDAQVFADKVASGMLNIDMSLDADDDSAIIELIQPKYGDNFGLILGLMAGLMIAGSIVYLVLKYKQLAVAPIMSMLSFIAISLIIMPLLSAIQITLASFIGFLIVYAITLAGHVVYLEKAKNEYVNGKKLLASFKSSFVKSVLTNVDIDVVVMLACLSTILFATGAIKAVAIMTAILLLPSALCTMLIHRGMVKWYLDINPTKYQKMNFEKGVTANEE